MQKFKLTQIDKDARERFGDLVIEVDDDTTVTLVHSLRMSDEQRAALNDAPGMEEVESEDDLVEVYHTWARCVAENESQAEALIDAVGKRLDLWAELQIKWTARTQAGEASTSES